MTPYIQCALVSLSCHNEYHRLGGLTTKACFLSFFGGYKFKTEVPADLISGESSLPSFRTAAFLCLWWAGREGRRGGRRGMEWEGGREKKRKLILWGHSPSLTISFNWIISIKALSSNVTTVDSGASAYGFGEHNSGHSVPSSSPGSSLFLGTRDKRQHSPPSHDSLPQLNSFLSSSYHAVAAPFQYGCESAWRIFLLKPKSAGQGRRILLIFLTAPAPVGKSGKQMKCSCHSFYSFSRKRLLSLIGQSISWSHSGFSPSSSISFMVRNFFQMLGLNQLYSFSALL